MDAYYASVEVMDDPSLKGKPVIVGGSIEGRGVVSAASYEARKFGVHSAMSAYRAMQLCPQAIVVSPRMSRYAELSRDIRAIFHRYTPLVEPLSLDEAFLDVTGSQKLFGDAVTIGREIKHAIKTEVGLVASVGVAPNKFLAKLASDLEKPDGFTVFTQEDAAERLADLPVKRLWGVGKVTQANLAAAGIMRVRHLLEMPIEQLEKIVGSNAARLRNLAQGKDHRAVVTGAGSKSIGHETTFNKDIADADRLRSTVDRFAEQVARRLREHGYLANTVNLKARYADFTTVTRAITLPSPSDHTRTIRDAARELLDVRLERKGRALRLIGVSVSNLVSPKEVNPTLFDNLDDDSNLSTTEDRKETKLDSIIDQLQDRFGSESIHRGMARGRAPDLRPGQDRLELEREQREEKNGE